MNCNICPQNCNANRISTKGICNALQNPIVSKYQLHMWEEPVISGTKGSGTVFFTGCNLKCVFCQNHTISHKNIGKEISVEQLSNIFLELMQAGAHNINLVTPTHFTYQIVKALTLAKLKGLAIPIIYNSNGYENISSLKALSGLIDIYLPDIKYFENNYAENFSGAKNYFAIASAAVLEMYSQVGDAVIKDGLMKRGIIVRHLVLPSLRNDSMKILDWVQQNIPNVYVSLLAQYIPLYNACNFKEINRKITTFEYSSVVDYFNRIGLQNGFIQNRESATEDYIPDFLT